MTTIATLSPGIISAVLVGTCIPLLVCDRLIAAVAGGRLLCLLVVTAMVARSTVQYT